MLYISERILSIMLDVQASSYLMKMIDALYAILVNFTEASDWQREAHIREVQANSIQSFERMEPGLVHIVVDSSSDG